METEILKKSKDLTKQHEWFELLTGRKLMEPEKRYDFNGRKFPGEYLASIKGAIAIFPPKIAALYIQKYSKWLIDKGYVNRVLLGFEHLKMKSYDKWSAEDLGEIAYMIIKSKNDRAKKSANEIYESYNIYLGNRILQIAEEIEKQERNLL